MTRTLTLAVALLVVVGGSTADALAQAPVEAPAQPRPAPQAGPRSPTPPSAPTPDVTFGEDSSAQATRFQLQRLLRQLPPPVVEALRSDPALLQSGEYLALYPALVAFLGLHPEVVRNSSFFLGEFVASDEVPGRAAMRLFESILGGLAALTGVSIFVGFVVWLVRTAVDHRRWLRLSRTQADVHTKIIDRLASNEDLLTYVQSPAGRRFLESAPITVDGEAPQATAPLSRIIWSLQGGVVLVALGLGLWFAQNRVSPEVGQGFSIMGTIVLALGAGFVASAGLAYAITSRLGLVPSPKPSDE